MNAGAHVDTLSCLLFSAIWLRCNQSLLAHKTQSAKDTDIDLFQDAPTCLQVGPMSMDWLVDPFARSDFSRSSLPPEVPSGEQQQGAFPVSTFSRWRQDALQTLWPFPFRRPAMYYLEHQRSRWIDFFHTQEQRVKTQIFQEALCHQQHLMSPGSAWKERVPLGYSGVGSAISTLWYLYS